MASSTLHSEVTFVAMCRDTDKSLKQMYTGQGFASTVTLSRLGSQCPYRAFASHRWHQVHINRPSGNRTQPGPARPAGPADNKKRGSGIP